MTIYSSTVVVLFVPWLSTLSKFTLTWSECQIWTFYVHFWFTSREVKSKCIEELFTGITFTITGLVRIKTTDYWITGLMDYLITGGEVEVTQYLIATAALAFLMTLATLAWTTSRPVAISNQIQASLDITRRQTSLAKTIVATVETLSIAWTPATIASTLRWTDAAWRHCQPTITQ